MSLERYFYIINKLSKFLGFENPISLDNELSATLVVEGPHFMLIKVSYDLASDTLFLKAPVSANLPKSRLGVQHMMNQLVGDLLSFDKSLGKLVADPEHSTLYLVKELRLNQPLPQSISEIFSSYQKQLLKWQQKLGKLSQDSKKINPFEPKEILIFNSL